MNKLRKTDVIFLTIILLLITCSFITYFFYTSRHGKIVQIEVNRKVVKTLPLSKNTRLVIHGYRGGKNILRIRDGYADMIEADCPDKLCVKQKKINKTGETIICLPHRIVVTIVSKTTKNVKDTPLDGVAN